MTIPPANPNSKTERVIDRCLNEAQRLGIAPSKRMDKQAHDGYHVSKAPRGLFMKGFYSQPKAMQVAMLIAGA